MLNGLRDVAYRGLVNKEAEELKQRLGFKDQIISYLGGEEESTIPNRKSAYVMLYEALIEKLDDDDALKLAAKKDLFILKRKVSILWEDFEDKKEEKERKKKIEVEKQVEEEIQKLQRKLQKVNKLKDKLNQREAKLLEELRDKKKLLNNDLSKETTNSLFVAETVIEADDKLTVNNNVEKEVEEQVEMASNEKLENTSKVKNVVNLEEEPKIEKEEEKETEEEPEEEPEEEKETEEEKEKETKEEASEDSPPFNLSSEEPSQHELANVYIGGSDLNDEEVMRKFETLDKIVMEHI